MGMKGLHGLELPGLLPACRGITSAGRVLLAGKEKQVTARTGTGSARSCLRRCRIGKRVRR